MPVIVVSPEGSSTTLALSCSRWAALWSHCGRKSHRLTSARHPASRPRCRRRPQYRRRDGALAVRARAGRQAVLGPVGRDRRVFGEDLKHAAGGIAVKLGQRAAQQLNTLGGDQARRGCLALAVWHGGGNAVDQDAKAAHARGRARTKTAHQQLQVLREILPVPDLQAGHSAHQFREIDQRGGRAKRIDLHRVNRTRCIKAALLGWR
jgi:hypothetical protein